MTKIKTVPSKVFNAGVDKWLKLANGELIDMWTCSYCSYYKQCETCPLAIKKNPSSFGSACCNGLWIKYSQANIGSEKIASRIADFIISRCVYEVE